MSITDDQKEIVSLGTVHGWIFKVSLWLAPLCAVWLVSKVMAHDTDIAVLKMQIMMGGKGVSQNVNVGQAVEEAAEVVSARDYLTTADIAAREKVSERTVTQWITEGRLEPVPEKEGKSWVIAKNVRILPQFSEECGEERKP